MFLGIDLGTSSVKLLLMDEAQAVCAQAEAPLTVQNPQPTWSEQHPADWWQALELAVQKMREHAPHAWRQIRAIGLSGQMHGAVVLDEQRQVLRPAILWNDGRSEKQCQDLECAVQALRRTTGNMAMPGLTAPKLLWLREHEPERFKRIQLVLLPKDWLRLQLTGDAVSDMSDASGTLWLNVARRCWSEPMLAACGLSMRQMPRLVEGSECSGVLLPAVARAWGLGTDVAVAGGAGDNAASAVGLGLVEPGEGFVSLGTSGVIFSLSDGYHSAPDLAVHAFAHALPRRWHQMSVMLSAASSLSWLTQLVGAQSERELEQVAAKLSSKERSQAPIFLPYLSGERTPHNNPHATGSFVGLCITHRAADLAYAVMEGVSFGLRDGWSAMGQGQDDATLALIGGGARSDMWAQLIASNLNVTLKRPVDASAVAALGAARLGMMACGAPTDVACQPLQIEKVFQPLAEQQAMLATRYAQFRALYPATCPS
ncbi:MAG: xylulokinase [Cytophagales bacterium]|nr:xylulokinase [Cytophagales bacterium]